MDSKRISNRKAYAAPRLVRHGDAVTRTLGGSIGFFSEFWGRAWWYNIP